jgi:hypothetical protein
MRTEFEGNEDWVARDEGRIRTKGAMAAERASAGLGTSDDDAPLFARRVNRPAMQAEPAPRDSGRESPGDSG